MGSRSIMRGVAAGSIVAAAILFCTTAIAQRDKATFKKGDRVEVEDGFDWKPGTVIGTDRPSGWIEVRLDQADLPDSVPKHVRERHQTRRFPADNVERSRAAAVEKPAKEEPIRKWTDRTGKFSVNAHYQSASDDRVVLLKADGKRIEVPTAKLSDEDGRYLRRIE